LWVCSDAILSQVPRVRVALSAFAAPRDRERALAAGFQRHVAKPVDPAALLRLLEEMLEDTADTLGATPR
jgi:CheY-like chemotaxis protein